MIDYFGNFTKDIGALRLALVALVALLILAAPFADGRVYMHDWRLFPSVIAPSIMMMIVFVIPLDITMAAVFKSSVDAPAEKQRFKRIILLDVFLFIAMIGAWTPFMFNVLDISFFS